jgi:chromosome segregation ATPase
MLSPGELMQEVSKKSRQGLQERIIGYILKYGQGCQMKTSNELVIKELQASVPVITEERRKLEKQGVITFKLEREKGTGRSNSFYRYYLTEEYLKERKDTEMVDNMDFTDKEIEMMKKNPKAVDIISKNIKLEPIKTTDLTPLQSKFEKHNEDNIFDHAKEAGYQVERQLILDYIHSVKGDAQKLIDKTLILSKIYKKDNEELKKELSNKTASEELIRKNIGANIALLQDEVSTLKTLLKTTQEDKEKFQSEIKMAKEEILNYRGVEQSLGKKISDLQDKLAQSEDDKIATESLLKQQQETSKFTRDKEISYQKQIDEITKKLNDFITAKDNDMKKAVSKEQVKYNDILKGKEDALKVINEKSEELQRKLSLSVANNEGLEKRVKILQKKIQALVSIDDENNGEEEVKNQ